MNRFRPTSDLPAGPPPEVLDEIDAAWERAQGLLEDGFDFRLERFSATEVIALACGQTVEAMLGRRLVPASRHS